MEEILRARPARAGDAPELARIYNEGIEDRVATFETRLRSSGQVVAWLEERGPVVVVERDGAVAAFARVGVYSARECYAGIGDCSVYVAREHRGRGAGRAALAELIRVAEAAGYWKLVARIFPENTASRRLVASLGFREVGVHHRHARLDGVWRDVVLVERLLSP